MIGGENYRVGVTLLLSILPLHCVPASSHYIARLSFGFKAEQIKARKKKVAGETEQAGRRVKSLPTCIRILLCTYFQTQTTQGNHSQCQMETELSS